MEQKTFNLVLDEKSETWYRTVDDNSLEEAVHQVLSNDDNLRQEESKVLYDFMRSKEHRGKATKLLFLDDRSESEKLFEGF